MKSRRSIIIIEGFYKDPLAIRDYALRQRYYTPYEDEDAVRTGKVRATWWATRFRSADECPFKSSEALVKMLENAVGETIDSEHWRASYPVDAASKPIAGALRSARTCLWNCCFHVKPDNGQRLGDGVHNHVTDSWNRVGPEGWAGLIYLNPVAPLEGGLHLWRNVDPTQNFDWMSPSKNWESIDSFANLFNRLILVRGDIPHSGARGWGDSIQTGRMYQTFFFRTLPRRTIWPVSLPEVGA
ncbi:MAG TPA: hypothetical protein VGW58_17545 [Pyrinomonadaceae bacterium]|nr:hypothetical protein [Pyrinomonadaceae bacterium]